jgi:hypothetical protein
MSGAGMSIRRIAAFLLALLPLLVVTPAAVAQDGTSVAVTLSSQTPFATPREPEVSAQILARNDGGDPLDNLSLRATVWSQVLSIGAYESSLQTDPAGSAIVRTSAQPIDGTLQSGGTRHFGIQLRMQSDGISTVQSYVYPLKLELLSGNLVVATVRSAIVVVVRRPQHPIAVSTRVALTAPFLLDAEGVFTSGELEADIEPRGRIGAAVASIRDELASDHRAPLDVVASPVLLYQLDRMRQGYSVVDGEGVRTVAEGEAGSATAAGILADLRAIAQSGVVRISAWPFGAASIPSLLENLSRDLPAQITRGRGLVNRLLGERAPAALMYPPNSAVTPEAIDQLVAQGARLLMLDPDVVPADAQPQGFAPPSVRRLASAAAPDEAVAAVVPHAGVQDLLTSVTAETDPVLAAQQAIGEIAAIWLEQPGIERPFAVAVPDRTEPNAALAPALIRRIAAAPFVRPVTATGLVDEFPPPDEPSVVVPLDVRTFSAGYASAIKHSRRLIDSYRSMLVAPSADPKQLKTQLLLLEGAQFLNDEAAGLAQIRAIDGSVNAFLGRIRVDAVPLVTFASRTGQIPLQVVNNTGQPVSVNVHLLSPHLTIGGEQTRRLTLTQPQQAITFDVELKTTGEFPVQVELLAPSGRPISDTTIAVRSTAYNRFALVITIGAAVALLALWGRRFLPSRRRTT